MYPDRKRFLTPLFSVPRGTGWVGRAAYGYMIAGDVDAVTQSGYHLINGGFTPMHALGFVPTIGWAMAGARGVGRGYSRGFASQNRVIAAAEDGLSGGLLPASSLNRRQLVIHNALAESGATGRFLKREVSMTDLRAIGRVTGDEYSVYTLGSRRLVIRGYGNEIRVTASMADDLAAGRLGRWSGHTHPPGYGLEASSFPYDRAGIPVGQQRSALWGDPTSNNVNGFTIFHRTPSEDVIFQSERNRAIMRRFYESQQ